MKPSTKVSIAQAVAAVAGLIVIASLVWARTPPGSGLTGSVHDFTRSENSIYQVTGNMCAFCHVRSLGTSAVSGPPWGEDVIGSLLRRSSGDALDAMDALPVWSHALADASYYTMYQPGSGAPTTGPTASQATAIGMTPGSISLVCLGCHDGSVAMNVGRNSSLVGKNKYLGNHHPVGFNYDAARSMDKELRLAEFAHLTTSTTVRDHLYGSAKQNVECGTCHSVHNTGNSGETLLWKSNAGGRLCLTCHDKGAYPGP